MYFDRFWKILWDFEWMSGSADTEFTECQADRFVGILFHTVSYREGSGFFFDSEIGWVWGQKMIKKGPPKRRSIRPQKRGVYTHCVHSLMLRGACLKLARCLPTCLHACPADPSARKTWIMTEITTYFWRSRSEVLERCWERCLPEAGEVPASLPACMPSVSFFFWFVF